MCVLGNDDGGNNKQDGGEQVWQVENFWSLENFWKKVMKMSHSLCDLGCLQSRCTETEGKQFETNTQGKKETDSSWLSWKPRTVAATDTTVCSAHIRQRLPVKWAALESTVD